MNKEILRTVPFAIKLEEQSAHTAGPAVPSKVQIMRTGQFNDPRYGNFEITADTLRTIKKNFDDNVRRIDVSIDFAHNSDLEAAGWVKELELSEGDTELWATVKWTPTGAKKLSDAEFRYLSADFVPNYQDNESLKKFGPCLLGAGLTNRPVIKGMDPVIELQEGKGEDMDPKDKKIKELSDELNAVQGKHKELEEKHEKMASEYAEFKKKSGAGENADKDSGDGADSDKADGEAQDDKDNMKKELAEIKEKLATSEKKGSFAKLLAEGKAVPAQEKAFLEGDMLKFAELGNKAINTKGIGHANSENNDVDGEETVADKVLKLADKKVESKKAKDIGEGISLVLAEDKSLRAEYEKFNSERLKG